MCVEAVLGEVSEWIVSHSYKGMRGLPIMKSTVAMIIDDGAPIELMEFRSISDHHGK